MKKIVIVSFYELKDYLLNIESIFIESFDWNVVTYPLYMYSYDTNSKIDNYTEHFSEFLKKESPDVLLWWFSDVQVSVFRKIKKEHPDIFYVFYNYSDPINLNKSLIEKCKIFDMIMTVCDNSLITYKIHCKTKYLSFFPMGYEPEVMEDSLDENINNDEYYSDIVFVCDGLYTGQDMIIPRERLIVLLTEYAKNNNMILSVYGPDFLKCICNSVYKGELKYIDSPHIFNSAKVNILSTPGCKKKIVTVPYMTQIMASKGLILMDRTRDIEKLLNKDKSEVWFYQDEESLNQALDQIFGLYETNPEHINDMKQNAKEFVSKYSWYEFCKRIFVSFNRSRLDKESYIKIYQCTELKDKSDLEIFKHWENQYFKLKRKDCILHKVVVPDNFDIENYRETYGISDERPDKYVYIHWYYNGRNNDYMKRVSGNSLSLSGTQMNLPTTKLFDLFRGFNMLYSYQHPEEGIRIIDAIYQANPGMDINKALDHYIDMSVTE